MTLTVTPSGQACGARIEGIDLTQELTDSQIAELRQLWLKHKVIALPNQALSPEDLERVAQYFGEVGEDPFFGHIDGYPNICAIQRDADEKTPIFAEIFHTDWSFMAVPPAGTALFGITIPPHGGDTLFADQVKAYKEMPDELREKVEGPYCHTLCRARLRALTAPMAMAIKKPVAACRSNPVRKHGKPVPTHL